MTLPPDPGRSRPPRATAGSGRRPGAGGGRERAAAVGDARVLLNVTGGGSADDRRRLLASNGDLADRPEFWPVGHGDAPEAVARRILASFGDAGPGGLRI